MNVPPPIVMQTLWRSRGTYFWSLFRKNHKICAFIEPLHEGLLYKTNEDWIREYKNGATKNLRHPDIEAHYFNEYPIRQNGGVHLFREQLSYEKFILNGNNYDEDLEKYLKYLKSYAEDNGRRAFFKFTRGGLRAEYIAKILGGTQIYLNRPVAEIHASYTSFGASNYFTSMLLYITIKNRTHPFCAALIEGISSISPIDTDILLDQLIDYESCYSISSRIISKQSILITSAYWLAYLLEGLKVGDVIMDTEKLGCDSDYRAELGQKFENALGPNPFGDYSANSCEDDFVFIVPALRNIYQSDPRLSRLWATTSSKAESSLGASSLRLLDALTSGI